jgi:hypothetical protein
MGREKSNACTVTARAGMAVIPVSPVLNVRGPGNNGVGNAGEPDKANLPIPDNLSQAIRKVPECHTCALRLATVRG